MNPHRHQIFSPIIKVKDVAGSKTQSTFQSLSEKNDWLKNLETPGRKPIKHVAGKKKKPTHEIAQGFHL